MGSFFGVLGFLGRARGYGIKGFFLFGIRVLEGSRVGRGRFVWFWGFVLGVAFEIGR